MAATTLHASLTKDLSGLLATLGKKRQTELKKHKGAAPLKPLDADDLRSKVDAIWSKNHDEGPSSRKPEVIRGTMDVVGRDIALRPVVAGEVGTVAPPATLTDINSSPSQSTAPAKRSRHRSRLRFRTDSTLC